MGHQRKQLTFALIGFWSLQLNAMPLDQAMITLLGGKDFLTAHGTLKEPSIDGCKVTVTSNFNDVVFDQIYDFHKIDLSTAKYVPPMYDKRGYFTANCISGQSDCAKISKSSLERPREYRYLLRAIGDSRPSNITAMDVYIPDYSVPLERNNDAIRAVKNSCGQPADTK